MRRALGGIAAGGFVLAAAGLLLRTGLAYRAADRAFHLETIRAVAREEGVDPLLLAALVRAESGFRAWAVSPRGARGLAQVLPGTAAEVAGETIPEDALHDPVTNLRLGARYLRKMQDRFGDTAWALAAYNAGPRAVAEYLSDTAAGGARDLAGFPKGETRKYVRRVLETYRILAVLAAFRRGAG